MIEQFLQYHRSLNHSENTIQSFEFAVRKFTTAFPQYLTADRAEIRQAIPVIFAGQAASTYNLRLTALKSFYKFLHSELGVIAENPIADMVGAKKPQRLPQTTVDTRSLYNEEHKDFYDKRNSAIIAVLLATGLRVSELCDLNGDNVRDNTIRVIGKGNKERIVFLNKDARLYLKRYNAVKPESEAWFCNKHGERLTRRAVELIIEKRSGGRVTPHMLRHDFCTTLIKRKVGIETVSLLMGHSSISTTQRYIHLEEADLYSSYSEAMDV
jgi:site-specific recombinase XerD